MATGIGSCEPLHTPGQPVPRNRGYKGGCVAILWLWGSFVPRGFCYLCLWPFCSLEHENFWVSNFRVLLEPKFSVEKLL